VQSSDNRLECWAGTNRTLTSLVVFTTPPNRLAPDLAGQEQDLIV
jgi:hypothetical protein